MPLVKFPSAAGLEKESCCCGPDCCRGTKGGEKAGIFDRSIDPVRFASGRRMTAVGEIPIVAARLGLRDRWGALRVRLGIGRGRYAIAPGLYALGSPDPWSPVFVTANYKLSFDALRTKLPGIDAWILVLDTGGINVWCAAGKGTFGADEVAGRLEASGLKKIVFHRTLILPQLGAPGASAPEIARRTGFRAVFGPVRAADLKAFLDAGMTAAPEMRRVRFSLRDRLILVPMELAGVVRSKFFLAGLGLWLAAMIAGIRGAPLAGAAAAGAIFAGAAATPVLLPWIPGRMFATKGAILGVLWASAVCLIGGFPPAGPAGLAATAAALLFLPALSAFLAMNFTGSSTFTSLSGVVAEMKVAVPVMLTAAGLGLAAAVLAAVIGG